MEKVVSDRMEEPSTSSAQPILQILAQPKPAYVCAPMVRYSKLSFRKLVRGWGADLVFTPMIISSSFAESPQARDAEFTTDVGDRPLVVQFAAANGPHFARATEFVAPYADGVDLNCGCPQRWAMAEGYGSKLIYEPDKVADMVAHVRRLPIPNPHFTVSVKIRLRNTVAETVELCRQAEAAGADFLIVHARTPTMRHDPILMESLAEVKAACRVPVIGNGDVFTLEQGTEMAERTGVDGVMSARGILHNPALFTGAQATPLECIQDWVEIGLSSGLSFTTFHHHAMFMLDRHLSKAEKRTFNRLQSTPAVLDFLRDRFHI